MIAISIRVLGNNHALMTNPVADRCLVELVDGEGCIVAMTELDPEGTARFDVDRKRHGKLKLRLAATVQR